jgi:hypothetical protein
MAVWVPLYLCGAVLLPKRFQLLLCRGQKAGEGVCAGRDFLPARRESFVDLLSYFADETGCELRATGTCTYTSMASSAETSCCRSAITRCRSPAPAACSGSTMTEFRLGWASSLRASSAFSSCHIPREVEMSKS